MRTCRSTLVPLFVALLILFSGVSWADSRDLYVLVHGTPSLLKLSDPLERLARTTSLSGSLGVTSYYGLTDTLHLGAALTTSAARGITYADHRVTLPSGSRPLGDLRQDLYGVTLGLLAHYRHDTGELWAPFAQLELGGTYLRHTSLKHFVAGTQLHAEFADMQQLLPSAGVKLGLEYRIRNIFTASVGVGVRTTPVAPTTWEFELPLTFGVIFR